MSLVIKQRQDNVKPEPLEPSAVENQQAIHLLPCKIHPRKSTADNQTLIGPVDQYFHPYVNPPRSTSDQNADTALWYASLRGKPLTGVNLDMPEGYVGLLCNRSSGKTENENSTATGDLVADESCGDVLTQLTYWNWDRVPSREDPLLSAFDWVRVSEAFMTDND